MMPDPTTMADAFARDRLQPSLFDRLNDELATALIQLGQDRRALDPLLDDVQRQALSALLADERLERRPPAASGLTAFATLTEDGRLLLDRIITIEISRRQQTHRSAILSTQELRAVVLRDLQNLLNTTCAEADLQREGTSLADCPAVQASVLNYGIPSLAGRIRTPDDVVDLAQEIERAIERFEPRVRQIRVRVADGAAEAHALSSPLELIIDGELWGYPVAEHLRVHTVLDLDAGHAEIMGAERLA
jgi:type VI secretion system protein ImpF